ncbi:MAG: SDR family NAD(P)-dependent oxidoreductase [bacterium]
MRLRDRVAVITGGASGIGRATALVFAREGASTALFDLDEGRCADVASQVDALGARALTLKVDVSNAEQVKAAVDRVVKAFGKIDILVNNAGYRSSQPFEELSEELWDRMIAVCLKGPFLCCKFVLPHILERGYGRIINIGSAAGTLGVATGAHYAAAKSGLVGLTRSLARVVSGRGDITCNSLAPAFIDTGFYSAAQDVLQQGKDMTLVKRVGTPEDVAYACLYFASEESSYVTGANLNISGGVMVGPT